MTDIIIAAGIPSAIMGLLVWFLKKHIDKKENARDEREKNMQKLMLMSAQTSRANYVLISATAKAVQRIPDAKCNGDMVAALEQAKNIQTQEREFLMELGIQHIFDNN
jgi:uncharacterized protein YigA (DUF484 family)